MSDLFENPMGLDGFEFVEFSSSKKNILEPIFIKMGFAKIAKHRSKDAYLWRQNSINIIINYEQNCQAFFFAQEHGAGACSMAFRVKDAKVAFELAVKNGAEPAYIEPRPMELYIPAIKAIGGALIYFVDRYEPQSTIYDVDFIYDQDVDRHPQGCGFQIIDHLTHNVYGGRMKYWGSFYENIFNFREIRYFDIKGEYTGLVSRAMTSPCGKIRIPLNEEGSSGKGQIEEYLLEYNGEGIQHIALACDDLYGCWDKLKDQGMSFMASPPASYYEMLEERLPGHGENIEGLMKRGILLDGSVVKGDPRLLLQIFSKTIIGPIFFEFIQRKKDDGFGEGNFKALFESIEREQIKRGVFEDQKVQ